MMSFKFSTGLFSRRLFSKKNLVKEELLKKLTRVQRAKEVNVKMQDDKQINKVIKPSELDKGYNTRIIEEMILAISKEGPMAENEYVKLIEKMREMKKEETKK